MEGLSIDVKKFASDASTFFNRARQYTEEQLRESKTGYKPGVETRIFGQILHFFFCENFGERWLKIGKIWLNSSSQKVPRLMSYTPIIVHPPPV